MRTLLAALLFFALAACQTVPQGRVFTQAQLALLTQEGFKQSGRNFELGLSDRLLFPLEGSDLAASQSERLHKLSAALMGVGIAGARVEGNTDSTGAQAYNQMLSERRAEAVKRALITGGMPDTAIAAVGLGENNPLESNASAEGRRENRRVVIIVSPDDAS